MITACIIGFIVVLVLIWFIATMNGMKVARLKVDEAESGIDVALTKRYDVLTKLLECVKGYAKHEQETLYQTIALRSGMSMSDRQTENNKMSQLFKDVRLLAESYPDLKASQNFVQLQNSITDVEEHLQAARRLYNANVTSYNRRLIVFPSSIVAGICGMTKREFFEAEENKRQDVEIKF